MLGSTFFEADVEVYVFIGFFNSTLSKRHSKDCGVEGLASFYYFGS